ncbi:MAG: hypothetical protein ACKV0T_19030 [Planctomycetales bacterium]
MLDRRSLAAVATWLGALCAGPGWAGDFFLVDGGQSRVTIYAPGENEAAGRRLADRVQKLTGVHIAVATDEQPPAAPVPLVALGTPESNRLIANILATDQRIAGLGDEGYLLQVIRRPDRVVLLAAGQSLAGVQHAISELVSWKLKLSTGGAAVDGDLNDSGKPSLRYRMVWTWDGHCNWAPTVAETMALYVRDNPAVGSTVVPYTPEGFRTHMTRAIDYLSDHKLNGLIVWGFLRDEHGGVEMGREISRYARLNNVRILPGVCSQGGYGGFIFSRTNKFNLEVWCQQHPELRALSEQGEPVNAMIDPSHPENQQWLREGAEWLFTNLPDLGGINLENGDFMSCYCDVCRTARSQPENDPNCFWDMMTSQKPILEVARRMRPDGWMTFASYVGFTEPTARGVSKNSVYPPKFVQQTPDNAICQWTFTSMTTPETWPEGARPPRSRFRDEIGLLHHGSVWGTPMDPARWWSSPGAWNDEYSTLFPFICRRIAQARLGGLVITGQTGNQCPAHELNFVALEYFSWHPERSYEEFQRDRLNPLYGGAARSQLYLKLVRSTTKVVSELQRECAQARHESQAIDLDVRQRARWENLAGELVRRDKLALALANQGAQP